MRISRRSAPKRVEFRPVYTSDCEGMLFTHKLVGELLPFSGKVTTGEMVTAKALMGSAVGAIEDGEGEAR